MEDFWDILVAVAESAWDYVAEFFVTVILPILVEWYAEVVEYFRQLMLNPEEHIPFIMSTENNTNNPFINLINEELRGSGIIEGVYNKQTDELESLRYVGGNGVDEQIQQVVKNNPLTVLS